MAQSDYQDMIEIPVSTCEMVTIPKKKKRKNTKKKVIKKVNEQNRELNLENTGADIFEDNLKSEDETQNLKPTNIKLKKDKNKKVDIVSIQVAFVFILIVGILLTNIFWEDSGINRLIATAFNNESQSVKNYSDFTLSMESYENITPKDGVISVLGEGAIYSPCGGVVSKIQKDGDKYTLTVNHSDNFCSEFKNLDFCYFEEGETVFQKVPIAYTFSGFEMRMYSNDALLTNYVLDDGLVVWES